jgi:hypothetical protein
MPLLRLSIFLLAILISGCFAAHGPAFRMSDPPAHMAQVYVYKTSTTAGFLNWDVPTLLVDGVEVGTIRTGGYFPVSLAPGARLLTVTRSSSGLGAQDRVVAELPISLLAGEQRFVRFDFSLNGRGGPGTLSGWTQTLTIVPWHVGEREIADLNSSD